MQFNPASIIHYRVCLSFTFRLLFNSIRTSFYKICRFSPFKLFSVRRIDKCTIIFITHRKTLFGVNLLQTDRSMKFVNNGRIKLNKNVKSNKNIDNTVCTVINNYKNVHWTRKNLFRRNVELQTEIHLLIISRRTLLFVQCTNYFFAKN